MKRIPRRKFRLSFSSTAYFKKNHAAHARNGLARGWGQIGVEPYHPFIPVHLFAGAGFSVRFLCPRTREIIHCHSLGEANWGSILCWSDGHCRLFSQVIIPRQDSLRIAKELGVKHPVYPDGTLTVMTVDFVHVTKKDGRVTYTAYSIKLRPESVNRRIAEKLAIEKQYYLELGFEWGLLFKKDADQRILANIRFVETFVGISPSVWGSERWRSYEPIIYAEVISGVPLNAACRNAEGKLGMPKNSALTLVRFFVANRIWKIDWTIPINTFAPLNVIERCTEVIP